MHASRLFWHFFSHLTSSLCNYTSHRTCSKFCHLSPSWVDFLISSMVYLPDILNSLDNVFLSVTWLVFLMYLMKWILTLGNVFLGVAWLVYLSYACFISHLRPDLQFFGCFFSFDGWHMSIFFMIVEKNIYAMGICLIFFLFALVLNSFQWMQSIFFHTPVFEWIESVFYCICWFSAFVCRSKYGDSNGVDN